MKYKKLATKILSLFIISCMFSFIYKILNESTNYEHYNGLDKNSSYFKYLYFSITTTSSVGYGDIYPLTKISKALSILHQFIILLGLDEDLLKIFKIDFDL